ncbi:putative methyltransferase-domain-containing protein [Mycena alexandri]|uniref:Methyltransferase-domain-containing protein n=1 Tax=Mycena alexandri TaxID=1745969 RepID=A0AAD6TGL0_9AGAR|nr:putative methyltransferase-domain-containing protein [Mycena alexandri]
MMVSIHSDLFQILRGYASLIPPNYLQFPSHLEAQTINDFLVHHVLLNPHFQQYPPSKQFQKLFWKWVIPHLEKKLETEGDSEAEVDSRIYEHYSQELLTSSSAPSLGPGNVAGLTGQSPPPASYITHFWRPEIQRGSASVDIGEWQTTTLLESRTVIESGTTGLRTWLASLILAQYLILNPALVHRKRILELGSGVGFLGSVVASLQLLAGHEDAGNLVMSDINDSVLTRCRDNIQLPCNLSSSHPDVRCRFLDWAAALDPDGIAPLTSLLREELDADLILGADIVFDPDLIPALVAVLRLALASNSRPRTALIALTIRNPATTQKFTDSVRDGGLILEKLDVDIKDKIFMEPVEGGDANNGVNIFRITVE